MDQKNCLARLAVAKAMRILILQESFFLATARPASFILAVPSSQTKVYRGLAGRRDWTRTNDPHHVKVVL